MKSTNDWVYYLLVEAKILLKEANCIPKNIVYPETMSIVERAALKTCLETIKTIVEVGLETEMLKDE